MDLGNGEVNIGPLFSRPLVCFPGVWCISPSPTRVPRGANIAGTPARAGDGMFGLVSGLGLGLRQLDLAERPGAHVPARRFEGNGASTGEPTPERVLRAAAPGEPCPEKELVGEVARE